MRTVSVTEVKGSFRKSVSFNTQKLLKVEMRPLLLDPPFSWKLTKSEAWKKQCNGRWPGKQVEIWKARSLTDAQN